MQIGEYVADMCAQLLEMVSDARLPLLAHLLSMAQLEGERVARGVVPPEPGSGRPRAG